jgi:hypothetical protein
MKESRDQREEMAVLAVLTAAAREAEELIAADEDLDGEAAGEANRRLRLFMRSTRQFAR